MFSLLNPILCFVFCFSFQFLGRRPGPKGAEGKARPGPKGKERRESSRFFYMSFKKCVLLRFLLFLSFSFFSIVR